MTISEIINLLENLKNKHGDIEIYFDCPTCEKAFKPSYITTQTTHFTNKK